LKAAVAWKAVQVVLKALAVWIVVQAVVLKAAAVLKAVQVRAAVVLAL
jgi:hypothetical protein